ncbi:hypothetical protein [Puniceibacterium sediminis]|uniref:Sulfotransferase domain-containing protein n=1 Tax=Puniceibacterium sediminis TaxID=1608407 RepID=A0A238YMA0_9RHOB|nr:hypothetical protein [Puniceibacterium sediminis]SNR72257.1 hypothetical protein SAMN06265370_11842 [Puniceibacterium sediminis]
MSRRILLHIGSPKCGSTYLQQVMLKNAKALALRGIRYPHDRPAAPDHPGNAADLDQIDRAGLDALFAGGAHTVVLSHEDLYSRAGLAKPLAALAREDGTTVQVLAFLRPFSEFLFGDYSQFMKQHFETFLAKRKPYGGMDFPAFVQRRVRTLKPSAFLTNWQKQFPDTAIRVSSHRAMRNVLEHELGAGAALDWEVPHHSTNPSLRMEDCDRITVAMHDPAVTDRAIRSMFRAAFRKTRAPDSGRTPERIARIEGAFAAENTALLEKFGYDNRLPES